MSAELRKILDDIDESRRRAPASDIMEQPFQDMPSFAPPLPQENVTPQEALFRHNIGETILKPPAPESLYVPSGVEQEQLKSIEDRYQVGQQPYTADTMDKLARLVGPIESKKFMPERPFPSEKPELQPKLKRTPFVKGFSVLGQDIPSSRTDITMKDMGEGIARGFREMPGAIARGVEDLFGTLEETSSGNIGQSVGMGLAALGDAFALGGSAKTAYLNNILKERDSWENRYVKRYAADQRARLAEEIQRATLNIKKKESVTKEQLNKIGSKAVINRLQNIKTSTDPALQNLRLEYEKNPEALINSYNLGMLDKRIKDDKALYNRVLLNKERRKKSPMTPTQSMAEKAALMNNPVELAIFKRMYPGENLEKLSGVDYKDNYSVYVKDAVKKLEDADKADKGVLSKEALNYRQVLSAANDVYEVIARYNNLPFIDPNKLRLDTASGVVTDTSVTPPREIKLPVNIPVLGRGFNKFLSFINKSKKEEGKPNQIEFLGKVEELFAQDRVEKAGKALTGMEARLYNDAKQNSLFRNNANVISGIEAIRKAALRGLESKFRPIRSKRFGQIYLDEKYKGETKDFSPEHFNREVYNTSGKSIQGYIRGKLQTKKIADLLSQKKFKTALAELKKDPHALFILDTAKRKAKAKNYYYTGTDFVSLPGDPKEQEAQGYKPVDKWSFNELLKSIPYLNWGE